MKGLVTAVGFMLLLAALSYGRKAAERDAIVIDRFFGSKQNALTWAQTHPHFMTVRILTPDVKLTGK